MNKKITVLYVDDEPINLELFEIIFEEKFQVLTAESGLDGLIILRSNPEISVVISDMKMPGMNGIEFIRIARQEFPYILFFILTGFEITNEIADALNEKLIDRYFRKPFDMDEIEEAIDKAMR
jgi:two-component system, response regulator, stage 0 sporulation protein F